MTHKHRFFPVIYTNIIYSLPMDFSIMYSSIAKPFPISLAIEPTIKKLLCLISTIVFLMSTLKYSMLTF